MVDSSDNRYEDKDPYNPKDAVGVKKWRQFTTIPFPVIWELGVAMLEGARKYGRHNFRAAPVRGSVYVDAAMGHIVSWWEGEDIDEDSRISHLTKAIASLVVLRDAMIQGKFIDDRPPASKDISDNLQKVVNFVFDKHPEAVPAFINEEKKV